MCRILFIRSNAQSTFAAFVVTGLSCLPDVDFEQYPSIPKEAWKGIDKIYNPEVGFENLNKNICVNKQEVLRKLKYGYYDLVLFLDYDRRLLSYQEWNFFKRLVVILGQFKRLFNGLVSYRGCR